MKHIIKHILINYFKEIHSLAVEEELHNNSWNTDLHYKIIVNGKRYSARFINNNRTINPAFGALSNEQLIEQVRFTYYLREHGIPFMQIKENRAGDSFTIVTWNDKQYRFVLSNWIEGNILRIVQKILQKPSEWKQERFMIFLMHFKARFFKEISFGWLC